MWEIVLDMLAEPTVGIYRLKLNVDENIRGVIRAKSFTFNVIVMDSTPAKSPEISLESTYVAPSDAASFVW